MKRILSTSVLTLIAFSIILSCSADEDDSPPPSNIVQTPEPEPPAPTQYTLTVSAGEGGTVSSEGGTYEEGTSVNLTASPNSEYIFQSWSNGSTDNPLTVTVNQNITLTANFSINRALIALPIDYTRGSYFTRTTFHDIDWDVFSNVDWESLNINDNRMNHGAVLVDYNNDGKLDLIRTNNSNIVRQPNDFIIMKGSEEGFIIDPSNTNIQSTIHSTKPLLGDFDNNGFVDYFVVDLGLDYEGDYTSADLGENNILLMNYNGVFEKIDLAELGEPISEYHNGATADIDNDGDLDILVTTIKSKFSVEDNPQEGYGADGHLVYENDGSGNFTISTWEEHPWFPVTNFTYEDENYDETQEENMMEVLHIELYDINNDGFVDLVTGNADYKINSKIFFGSPHGFIEYVLLPSVENFTVVTDIDFLDLNNDGISEIILTRTGDDKGGVFYENAALQIVSYEGEDVTDIYISNGDSIVNTPGNYWIEELSVSNEIFIDDTQRNGNRPTWIRVNGKYTYQ